MDWPQLLPMPLGDRPDLSHQWNILNPITNTRWYQGISYLNITIRMHCPIYRIIMMSLFFMITITGNHGPTVSRK